MEVLLEVGGFDMDRCVEITMTQMHINVQKHDFRGEGVPSELNGIEVRINLPLFSTVLPSNRRLFLSCRPFVVITTFSTGLVGVKVTSVS